MRDPLIHVEKQQMLTHAEMRALIVEATGLAVDAPKTVATGCGKRRRYAMTSTVPERVTCLACREHAQHEHTELAEMIEAALRLPGMVPDAERECYAGAARQRRGLAKRFATLNTTVN